VRRWQVTLVVFLMLAALGVTSLFAIPKAEDPSFPYPNFAVVAVLPGASPKDVEKLVVDPLETKLFTLADVKSLKTDIEDGLAVVRVEFTAGSDPARKRDEVLREVSALRPRLPAELVRLDVNEFDAAKVNIVELGLVSETAPYRELDRLARALKKRLERVPGVGEAEIAGLPSPEITVTLAVERMVARGISPAEVLAAIGGEAANVPAGTLDVGARQLTVKTSGDFGSVEEIADTVIRRAGGAFVKLSDVADVRLGDAEPVHLVRWGGRRAAIVAANARSGQNVFAVRDAVMAELDRFEQDLPKGVTLARGFDQTRNVAHRLGGFTRDFGLAIVLVLVTLLPLGVRASSVVMVSIPLSLAVGLALLHFTGQSINQLSIVGFVIALGLLVDDSVVVVENIVRFLRLGYTPKQAAIKATEQITISILGCTATLVLAFVPLLALPGAPGLFIRSMPLAVVFTILASLLVALTIVPFLSSRWLKPEGEHGNAVFRAMTWVIEGSYRRVLSAAIGRPKTALAVSLALVAASFALVPRIGFSLFPKAGIPQFLVSVETPEGSSLAETDRVVREVEGLLLARRDVKNVVANVGKGNPRIYYNVAPRNEKSSVGEVFAELADREPHAVDHAFKELRDALAAIPGANIELREMENGPPLDAPIALRVLGDEPEAIEEGARRVEAVLREVRGTRYVRNPSRDRKSDLRVVIDREKAAILGVSIPDAERAVRLAVGGVVAAKFRDGGREEAIDVRVTLPRALPTSLPGGARPGVDVLDRIHVAAAAGAVPLAQVADVVFEPAPARIRHHAAARSETVTAYVEEGFNTDRVTKEVLAKLASVPMPKGVRIAPAGEIESRQESFGGLGSAIVIAAFGVLAVLVLEFRTFKSTLIVASVIPLGVAGGLLALWIAGYTLSFTANIGFIALMGIEVKNSILLVDFTNQLRAEGRSLDEAVQKAGEIRFVPILLTTLTALGGLVPLVLERSALYSPLAVVLVGGLTSSTLLARIVTPVLYKLLAPEAMSDDEPESAPVPATA
jgi:multidrug efflux pump subunit AcrB